MREANHLHWNRPQRNSLDPAVIRRLRRGRDYLAAHVDAPDLEQASAIAGYSSFYFQRLFTATFGETPHEFLTRLRMEQAKALLLGNHQSVTEICFQLGYESLGSFSTRFRSLTGLSPAQFRREARRFYGGWQQAAFFYVPACFLFEH